MSKIQVSEHKHKCDDKEHLERIQRLANKVTNESGVFYRQYFFHLLKEGAPLEFIESLDWKSWSWDR